MRPRISIRGSVDSVRRLVSFLRFRENQLKSMRFINKFKLCMEESKPRISSVSSLPGRSITRSGKTQNRPVPLSQYVGVIHCI